MLHVLLQQRHLCLAKTWRRRTTPENCNINRQDMVRADTTKENSCWHRTEMSADAIWVTNNLACDPSWSNTRFPIARSCVPHQQRSRRLEMPTCTSLEFILAAPRMAQMKRVASRENTMQTRRRPPSVRPAKPSPRKSRQQTPRPGPVELTDSSIVH